MPTKTEMNTDTVEKVKIDRPKDYIIVMHNDDVTPMDVVVTVLMHVFKTDIEKAMETMMNIHKTGAAAIGMYTKDIAETKLRDATSLAIALGGTTLKITMEDA